MSPNGTPAPPDHYLKLTPKQVGRKGHEHIRWMWECSCGNAKGEQDTEEACEFSHMRHLIGLTFRRHLL